MIGPWQFGGSEISRIRISWNETLPREKNQVWKVLWNERTRQRWVKLSLAICPMSTRSFLSTTISWSVVAATKRFDFGNVIRKTTFGRKTTRCQCQQLHFKTKVSKSLNIPYKYLCSDIAFWYSRHKMNLTSDVEAFEQLSLRCHFSVLLSKKSLSGDGSFRWTCHVVGY